MCLGRQWVGKYSDKLLIDFHQTSSNGKTALDWLEDAKINSDEKSLIRNLLLEKMQPLSSIIPGQ
jgi:hypothetical protein